jgi:HEAT repeat protein
VERHFAEIGFLLSQRPGYCDDPRVGWRRTIELEQRIGRHLDALAAWGAPGLGEACDAALTLALGEDALLGAVLALASSGGDPDPWPRLIAALRAAEPPAIALWVQGLSLAVDDGIGERLAPLLLAEGPDLRVAAATVMGYRRLADPGATASLLQALEPGRAPAAVRDAAALALGKIGVPAAAPGIDRALRHGPITGPLVEAALYLGVPSALDIVRWSIRDGVEVEPEVYVALALGGAAADASLLLQVSERRPDARRAVSTALGVLGVASTVPALIDRLADEDPGVARVAAEALHRITGASLQEKKWVPDDPGDPRPPPAVGAAGDGTWVERVSADRAAWTAHCLAHPLAGDPGQRFRRGRPFRLEECVAEAEDATTNARLRAVAIRELRARLARPAGVEPDDWVARQLAGLSQCRSLCAEAR